MKIRTFLLYAFCCLLAVNARAQGTQELLTKAVSLEGTNYLTIRNEVIDKGKDIIPELTRIQENKTADWKLQLMAGICKEWIEKQSEIEEMETKIWKSDPNYDREWDRYRPGPWPGLEGLVVRRYQEKKLWFYCLEAMWKGVERFPEVWGAKKGYWEWACQLAVEDSPMREWAIKILEDRVGNDLLFKNKKSQLSFIRLIDLKSRRSLPVLLKAWKAQGGLHEEFAIKIKNMLAEDDVDMAESFIRENEKVVSGDGGGMFRDRVKQLRDARDAKKQKDTPDKKDN